MTPIRTLRFASLVALAPVIAALLAGGCGSDDRSGAWAGTGPDQHGTSPCASGTTSDCHVTLAEHNGILTCAQGTQTCTNGVWGACEGTSISEQAVPAWYAAATAGGLQAQAISVPVTCNPENLCDPACTQYDENPDGGLTPPLDGGINDNPIYDWVWGSLGDFPGGLVGKELIEPCHTAGDCAFNTRCEYPDNGTCAHSICADGTALDASCDSGSSETSCVDMVCAVDSSCCVADETDPCTHDLCVTGEGLKEECLGCVEDICAIDPTCCDTQGSNTNWTAACVAKVATVCGNSCGCATGELAYNGKCYVRDTTPRKYSQANDECAGHGSGWALVTINDAAENAAIATEYGSGGGEEWIGIQASSGKAPFTWKLIDGTTTATYTNWNTGYGTAGKNHVGYMPDLAGADLGKWRDYDPGNDEKSQICEGPSSTMVDPTPDPAEAWDDECVDMVYSVCGAYCDDADPPAEGGECVSWDPGETDPNCPSSFDVSAAPTCSTGGDQVIPICNHGAVEAPAGLPIISFQGASNKDWKDYALKCNPAFDATDFADTCFTTEVIPPGECIEVTGCDLDNNGAVVVNPLVDITGDGVVDGNSAECNCLGNWTLVHPGDNECGEPACGTADGFVADLASNCEAPLPGADYDAGPQVLVSWLFDDGDATPDDPVVFSYVGSAGNCTNSGWYYSADMSKMVLCADACTRVSDVTLDTSTFFVELSCVPAPTYSEQSHFFSYTGTCGADRGVQWDFLGWDAVIPDGAAIEFRVAAATTEAGLPPSDPADPGWQLLYTADSTTELCPTNTDPTCARDIFQLLQLPDAQLPYLGLLITLVPTSDQWFAPTLNGWDITYSCPFNQ